MNDSERARAAIEQYRARGCDPGCDGCVLWLKRIFAEVRESERERVALVLDDALPDMRITVNCERSTWSAAAAKFVRGLK